MIFGIIAKSQNEIIGNGNTIPWKCSEDMKFFKEKTMGSVLVMGHKTYLSLPKKSLEGRMIYVLTRNISCDNVGPYFNGSVKFISKIEDVSHKIYQDVYICGGKQIYDQYAEICEEFYVTTIQQKVEGDIKFNADWLFPFDGHELVQRSSNIEINCYYKNENY